MDREKYLALQRQFGAESAVGGKKPKRDAQQIQRIEAGEIATSIAHYLIAQALEMGLDELVGG